MIARAFFLAVVALGLLVAPAHAQAGTPGPAPTSAFGPAPTSAPAPAVTATPARVVGSPVVVVGYGPGAQGTQYAILAAVILLGGIECVILFWLFIRGGVR